MSAQERRSHDRYSAHHLKVLVKTVDSDYSDWQTGHISTVDFNRYGIGLETAHSFSIGDVLSMVIRTDDATISEVTGMVCNRLPTDNAFRYGIRFEQNPEIEQTPEQMSMNEELLMIERQVAGAVH